MCFTANMELTRVGDGKTEPFLTINFLKETTLQKKKGGDEKEKIK